MPVNYTPDEKGDFLEYKVSGKADTPDQLFEYIKGFLADAESRGHHRILLDQRCLVVGLQQAGSYEVAIKCFDLIADREGLRVAIVTLPERMEFAKVYETMGVGRGVDIKAFTDRRVAIAWVIR